MHRSPSQSNKIELSLHHVLLGWIIGSCLLAVVWGLSWAKRMGTLHWPQLPATQQTACTLEAKICPDGSAVGRTGPNCEFAECPVVSASPPSSLGTNAPTPTMVDASKWLQETEQVVTHLQLENKPSVELFFKFPQPKAIEGPYVVENNALFSVVATRGGESFCWLGDEDQDCTYTDQSIPNAATFRIWTIDGKVVALNPQDVRAGGYTFNNILITKVDAADDTGSIYFTEADIAQWKKNLTLLQVRSSGQALKSVPENWATYRLPEFGITLRHPAEFEVVQNENWPNSLALFYNNGQTYELVIGKWNSLPEFKTAYHQDPDFFVKVEDGSYITFMNVARSATVKRIIESIVIE